MPLVYDIQGDRKTARSYIPTAKNRLAVLKQKMAVQKIPQMYSDWYEQLDGTVFRVSSVYGRDKIEIWSPEEGFGKKSAESVDVVPYIECWLYDEWINYMYNGGTLQTRYLILDWNLVAKSVVTKVDKLLPLENKSTPTADYLYPESDTVTNFDTGRVVWHKVYQEYAQFFLKEGIQSYGNLYRETWQTPHRSLQSDNGWGYDDEYWYDFEDTEAHQYYKHTLAYYKRNTIYYCHTTDNIDIVTIAINGSNYTSSTTDTHYEAADSTSGFHQISNSEIASDSGNQSTSSVVINNEIVETFTSTNDPLESPYHLGCFLYTTDYQAGSYPYEYVLGGKVAMSSRNDCALFAYKPIDTSEHLRFRAYGPTFGHKYNPALVGTKQWAPYPDFPDALTNYYYVNVGGSDYVITYSDGGEISAPYQITAGVCMAP